MNIHGLARAGLGLAVVGIVAGCATPSDPSAMVARELAVISRSSERVSVAVIGGKATSGMGASQIADEDFREALKQSILKAGLFREVLNDKGGHYHLVAFIGHISQPLFGGSFTVDLEVEYTLTEASSGRSIWQRSIKSSHTVTMGEAFAGVTRLRLANEGAARRNIEAALGEMGKLPLR